MCQGGSHGYSRDEKLSHCLLDPISWWIRHSGRHRFRCPSCSTAFCGECRVTPYHLGFDCQGWLDHQAKPKCTYCGDAAEVVARGEHIVGWAHAAYSSSVVAACCAFAAWSGATSHEHGGSKLVEASRRIAPNLRVNSRGLTYFEVTSFASEPNTISRAAMGLCGGQGNTGRTAQPLARCTTTAASMLTWLCAYDHAATTQETRLHTPRRVAVVRSAGTASRKVARKSCGVVIFAAG